MEILAIRSVGNWVSMVIYLDLLLSQISTQWYSDCDEEFSCV